MAQIFLSYASQDRLRVKPLAEALEARGFSVWWDRALGAGEDYASVISRELSAAKVVIVVWTEASAASTFVRDEAGRARDQGRLVPVMLDRVEIPLGFGAFQAEDFSAWNGRAEAAQMQLLEEAVHAKLEGRSIDGGAVAAKRRRLMSRIRIVSVLTVVAAIAIIAFVGNQFINPPAPQPDPRAQLLELLDQGKLTPEQAIELARLLETDTLGETQTAQNEAPAAEPAPGAADGMQSRTMAVEAEPAVATVTSAEFDTAARDAYRGAVTELLTSSDQRVRTATAQLSNPATRNAAMQTLWSIAQQGGPNAAAIYKVCGAVGEANNHPLGLRALEQARNVNPQDAQVWRMLSYGLRRSNQTAEAQSAALVGAGLQAQAQGQTDIAEQRLEQALPAIQAPEGRAFVEGTLGDVAAQRNDWAGASLRYRQALQLREQAAPRTPAAQGIQVDAQKLVRALDRDGRTEEACREAEQVQTEHDVAPVDQELAQRCQRLRIMVRPQILQQQQVAPAQRVQTAPVQRVQPAPGAKP